MSETSVKILVNQSYKYGFITDIESDKIPNGINEDIIRLISAKKKEPDFHNFEKLQIKKQFSKASSDFWNVACFENYNS